MGKPMRRCVVIGAAPVSDPSVLKGYLKEDDYIIAADGGQRLCGALQRPADRVIGDFDSSGHPAANPDCIVLTVQKDDTDVLAAVRDALTQGYRDFLFLGCLGGRLDHTLANMAVLQFLHRHGAAGLLVDERHEITLLSQGEHTVPPRPDYTVSFLPFGGEATGVTIRKAAYPTDHIDFHTWFPVGVSNEFTDQPLYISIENGQCLMILARKESF